MVIITHELKHVRIAYNDNMSQNFDHPCTGSCFLDLK